MLMYAFRRLLAVVPLLLLVSIISFGLVELAPGDAAVTLAGDQASVEDIQRVREALELDAPLVERYGSFLADVLSGDLGASLFNSQAVTTLVGNRLNVTVSLVLLVLGFAVVLGLPIGILAALRKGSFLDRALSGFTAVALAAPSFLIAVFLLKWFAIDRDVFPATGFVPISEDPWEWFLSLALPAFALAQLPTAELARIARAAMSDTLQQDYVQTARAKGLTGRQVVLKHTVKNAAVPVVTIFGVQLGRLIGGAVIVESIFALPGLGTLLISSVLIRDAPVIQGLVLMTAVAVVAINLLVDLSYGYFNPRTRH